MVEHTIKVQIVLNRTSNALGTSTLSIPPRYHLASLSKCAVADLSHPMIARTGTFLTDASSKLTAPRSELPTAFGESQLGKAANHRAAWAPFSCPEGPKGKEEWEARESPGQLKDSVWQIKLIAS
jgi:hypothetical protein